MFSNGKAPGNDGLTAEFYKSFWDLLGELSNSQEQAIIRLIDKKDKDRRYNDKELATNLPFKCWC